MTTPTESTHDGGPAFPAPHYDLAPHEHGLSIRDYFAAAALTGMLANPENSPSSSGSINSVVLDCYTYADAMLAARKGGAP